MGLNASFWRISNIVQVNTLGWAAGIYFCKVRMKDNRIITQKIIIQK